MLRHGLVSMCTKTRPCFVPLAPARHMDTGQQQHSRNLLGDPMGQLFQGREQPGDLCVRVVGEEEV